MRTVFAPQRPERMPAMFTLIYVGGFAFVILLLLLGLVRNRRRPVSTAAIPTDLPKAVKKRLGSTSTNRGLRALRWLFVLLSVGIYSFHVYWAQYAADRNDKFQELSYKDLIMQFNVDNWKIAPQIKQRMIDIKLGRTPDVYNWMFKV